jgi:hypothetical protein
MNNKDATFELKDEVLRIVFYLQQYKKSTVPMIEAYLKVFIPTYKNIDTFDIRDVLSSLQQKELIRRNIDIYNTCGIAYESLLFKAGDHILYLKNKEKLSGKIIKPDRFTVNVINDDNKQSEVVPAISIVGFKTINGYQE